MEKYAKYVGITVFVLLVVSGLNTGLAAICPSFDVIGRLFGCCPIIIQIFGILVGASAVLALYAKIKGCGCGCGCAGCACEAPKKAAAAPKAPAKAAKKPASKKKRK